MLRAVLSNTPRGDSRKPSLPPFRLLPCAPILALLGESIFDHCQANPREQSGGSSRRGDMPHDSGDMSVTLVITFGHCMMLDMRAPTN